MLREIEAREAIEAWHDIKAVSRDPERSLDDLHGIPMVDEMIAVRPHVLRAVRDAREQREREEAEREANEAEADEAE